ncbi:hypothetical protein LCGC14_0568640 [marine sediment metagenome]|uniref:site-specific DNA-methyltransferase (cytosine-N(4)-specific) n=1 Tax=marine sediment metagenome TaxID=412755 RepID=A0A0F9UT40_9ZZZZ
MIDTGDAIEVLATLPERHFHCVVTSPPYFGLRDYGTAEWEGGDATCDHNDAQRSFADGCIECGGNMDKFTGDCKHCDDRKLKRQLRGTPEKNYTAKDPTRPDLPNPPASWSTRDVTVKSVTGVCHKCGAKRIDRQGGLQSTPDEYVAWLVEVFKGVKRVLRDDGVCFVNLGDSYNANQGAGFNAHAKTRPHLSGEGVGQKRIPHSSRNTVAKRPAGVKPKDLMGMPWRVAFALQADGWWLRSAIIWHKPAPMPGSQQDRCTSSYEFVFQLTKRARCYFDLHAIREKGATGSWDAMPPIGGVKAPGNNGNPVYSGDTPSSDGMRTPRDVWKIAHDGFAGAHFATFPIELPTRCIKAATSERGCCPACGAAWVRVVEKDRKPTRPGRNNVSDETGRANRDEQRHVTETKTVGWMAACNCPLDTRTRSVPCRVLDPFMGAGTTAIAANRLGRDWTGIELNPEYVKMANDRIGKDANPATHRSDDAGDAPLFAKEQA